MPCCSRSGSRCSPRAAEQTQTQIFLGAKHRPFVLGATWRNALVSNVDACQSSPVCMGRGEISACHESSGPRWCWLSSARSYLLPRSSGLSGSGDHTGSLHTGVVSGLSNYLQPAAGCMDSGRHRFVIAESREPWSAKSPTAAEQREVRACGGPFPEELLSSQAIK